MRNIAVLPPIKSTVRVALMSIAASKQIATPQLIAAARTLPGGTSHIPERKLLNARVAIRSIWCASVPRCADQRTDNAKI